MSGLPLLYIILYTAAVALTEYVDNRTVLHLYHLVTNVCAGRLEISMVGPRNRSSLVKGISPRAQYSQEKPCLWG